MSPRHKEPNTWTYRTFRRRRTFTVGPIPVSVAPRWLWMPQLRMGLGGFRQDVQAGLHSTRAHLVGRFKAHPNPKLQQQSPRWGFMLWFLDVGSRG